MLLGIESVNNISCKHCFAALIDILKTKRHGKTSIDFSYSPTPGLIRTTANVAVVISLSLRALQDITYTHRVIDMLDLEFYIKK